MRAYLSVTSHDVARDLERAESLAAACTIEMLEQVRPGNTPILRCAHCQLAMTKNDWRSEWWRRLSQRYEPDAGPHCQNMITRILQAVNFLESPAVC